MIKIDLICGFLGSGKTTFIIEYAKYLTSIGEKICIIENDFGPINVDMMLLDGLNCDREMVMGGDLDCYKRRFKSKLELLKMLKYDRVIVEPSGIYDVDLFFDILYEESIINSYIISNIFFMYDINTSNLSYESRYIVSNLISKAGKIIITKRINNNEIDINYINDILKEFKSNRILNKDDIIYFDEIDFKNLINVGYKDFDVVKVHVLNNNNYKSLYYMNIDKNIDDVNNIVKLLFNGNYGNIIRIKGFIFDNNKWYKINITKNEYNVDLINMGQNVIIIIGENLKEESISPLFGGIHVSI